MYVLLPSLVSLIARVPVSYPLAGKDSSVPRSIEYTLLYTGSPTISITGVSSLPRFV